MGTANKSFLLRLLDAKNTHVDRESLFMDPLESSAIATTSINTTTTGTTTDTTTTTIIDTTIPTTDTTTAPTSPPLVVTTPPPPPVNPSHQLRASTQSSRTTRLAARQKAAYLQSLSLPPAPSTPQRGLSRIAQPALDGLEGLEVEHDSDAAMNYGTAIVPATTEATFSASDLPHSSIHKVPSHVNHHTKDHDPSSSSHMRLTRQKEISDRFISANAGSELNEAYHFQSTAHLTPVKNKSRHGGSAGESTQQDTTCRIYHDVLKNELLSPTSDSPSRLLSPTHTSGIIAYTTLTPSRKRILESPSNIIRSATKLSELSHRALQTPKKTIRYISKTPFKVLDAPELKDDFYLNLVDWSSTNILGVGLDSCVYLWNASTSKVTKLCDIAPHDSVSSVNWIQRGTHIAIGTNKGMVQLWDIHAGRKVRQFSGHQARVGVLAWNGPTLSSGSRDRTIHNHDSRISNDITGKLVGHRQEVCGLKWSPNETCLASGGNDNVLNLWDIRGSAPIVQFNEHTAAVKAIVWSPHEHGLLASGGGTADKCIRHWNTLTATPLSCIDTGSQVCNIAWSKSSNEMVSTHGFSQNQIIVWKYPQMTQVAALMGHTYRVLQLAMSPDGQHIVTGAGDETLRFWTVFNKPRSKADTSSSSMSILR
ncbi:hypothetical protein BASA50_000779 [Batrachochytrium salamandrivorans]|uniref:CDC20/Fizzy WD40 domain-containing protein n=1 Tax=Batrachochytrium salamandrivorans TaxID=1357716 RepID=A0ABQ8EVR3_9FUNG|nr:hypothetical protein BASA62_000166 [Batrachochytrium salamandrivorans]KAH6586074.1 hypothetical protein BASA50_000779 [Batrachochytrium salamandrivorans]KAH6599737.1 hypothetical protein BASA61_002505 [Batrachochytrium salamandrivorans]